MSFITGKHLPRRTFLRGMGATVALPFLDAMVPAGRVFAQGAGAPSAPGSSASKRCTALAGCNTWGASKYPVRSGKPWGATSSWCRTTR